MKEYSGGFVSIRKGSHPHWVNSPKVKSIDVIRIRKGFKVWAWSIREGWEPTLINNLPRLGRGGSLHLLSEDNKAVSTWSLPGSCHSTGSHEYGKVIILKFQVISSYCHGRLELRNLTLSHSKIRCLMDTMNCCMINIKFILDYEMNRITSILNTS